MPAFKTRNFCASFPVAILLSFVSTAIAGKYELVQGKDIAVCEAYQATLNASNPPTPLLCEREIHQHLESLREVEWKQLDLWENRDLYRDITAFLNRLPRGRSITEEQKDWLKRRAKAGGSPQLFITSVDINNDGYVDRVIQYKNGICGRAVRTYATTLLVMDNEEPRVDPKATELLLQNVRRDKDAGRNVEDPFNYLYNMYGVFSFHDEIYFDKTNARADERKRLNVYKISHNNVREICNYRFHQ